MIFGSSFNKVKCLVSFFYALFLAAIILNHPLPVCMLVLHHYHVQGHEFISLYTSPVMTSLSIVTSSQRGTFFVGPLCVS